ncbi:hypothetical protein NP590_09325 [Methylomonas sp. SURF-2]|uniref:Uncharacterized protein n=1 Tax=Methylomonas subterranea TaxID=2952225 RepID=A0ABT1TFR6_9GAMM|nr:hypothetical protein [Methylomonas sp. SURF-2]MCQ8104306.1 hypothetical protein [Methylomonas sp. SURF-2]
MPNLSMEQSNALKPHWLICLAMLSSLLIYNLLGQLWGDEIRHPLDEPQRIVLRTILYIVAIVLFPLTNLLRHILLRLNQTMPGKKTAGQRYLVTILVTQSMVEIVGLFGFIMFVLGDDFNTLYIFTLLGAVGVYLHKPKREELQSILDALSSPNRQYRKT